MARMWRERISFALLVGMQIGEATLETIWRFLKILKIELLYDPAIALLGIYPKDTKMLIQRAHAPTFTAALSTTARLWRDPN